MIEKANIELKEIKDKLKEANKKLHILEKLVPYEHMIRYFKAQKTVITLEREKATIKQAIDQLRKSK